MKRLLVLLMVCASGSAAFADDAQTARIMMAQALARLGRSTSATIDLTGYDTAHNGVVGMRGVAAVQFGNYNNRPSAFLEMITYRNDQMAHRIAGDGARLWSYDLGRKEYTSAEYGTESGEQYADVRRRAIMLSTRYVPSLMSMPMQVFRDAFAGVGEENLASTWVPWLPTSTIRLEDMNIICTSEQMGSNTLTYSLGYDDTRDEYFLSTVTYKKVFIVSGMERKTEWTARIYENKLPPDVVYSFSPPRDARPVAITSNRTGF